MEIRRQGGRLPPLQRTDAHRHGASGPGRAVGGDRPRLAAAGLRQLSAQGTAAPGRRPGPQAGELLHRAPARRRRRAGPGRQVRVSAAGRAAGAPPPARPERRAVLPRFPGRPAGPGRAVHRRHLRQRPRHGIPLPSGRTAGPGAGAGHPACGGGRHQRAAGRRRAGGVPAGPSSTTTPAWGNWPPPPPPTAC